MLKNIALAWLPVIVTLGSLVIALIISVYWLFTGVVVLGLIIWLLAFPNAHYLITELNFTHRKQDDPVPLYFDIVQTLTLTLSGILIGQLSLVFVHMLLILLLTPGFSQAGHLIVPDSSWFLIFTFILLASFAIYIGRNVRLNSWDVVRPVEFCKRLAHQLRDTGERNTAIGYTLLYSVLMMIFHVVLFGGFIYLLLSDVKVTPV